MWALDALRIMLRNPNVHEIRELAASPFGEDVLHIKVAPNSNRQS